MNTTTQTVDERCHLIAVAAISFARVAYEFRGLGSPRPRMMAEVRYRANRIIALRTAEAAQGGAIVSRAQPLMLLAYFPARMTEAGMMPAHYYPCNCHAELREAIAAGGQAVDSSEHWDSAERQFESEQECYS